VSARKSIHPATLASIEAQGETGDAVYDQWRCSCERDRRTGVWWMCAYHEGYDDARRSRRWDDNRRGGAMTTTECARCGRVTHVADLHDDDDRVCAGCCRRCATVEELPDRLRKWAYEGVEWGIGDSLAADLLAAADLIEELG
jgi:hypothetical protein